MASYVPLVAWFLAAIILASARTTAPHSARGPRWSPAAFFNPFPHNNRARESAGRCVEDVERVIHDAVSRVIHPVIDGVAPALPADLSNGCDAPTQRRQSSDFQFLWRRLCSLAPPLNASLSICSDPASELRPLVTCFKECIVRLNFAYALPSVLSLRGRVNSTTVGPSLLRTLGGVNASGHSRVEVDVTDLVNAAPTTLKLVNAHGAQVVGNHLLRVPAGVKVALAVLVVDGSRPYTLPAGPAIVNLVMFLQFGSGVRNLNEALDWYLGYATNLTVLVTQSPARTRIGGGICNATSLSVLSVPGWDGNLTAMAACPARTLSHLVWWDFENTCHIKPCFQFQFTAAIASVLDGPRGTPLLVDGGGSGIFGVAHFPNRTTVINLAGTLITKIEPPWETLPLCAISTRSSPNLVIGSVNASLPGIQFIDFSNACSVGAISLHNATNLLDLRISSTSASSIALRGVGMLQRLSIADSGVTSLVVVPANGTKVLPTLVSLWVGGAPLMDGLSRFPRAPSLIALVISDANVSASVFFRMMNASAKTLKMLSAAGSDFCTDAMSLSWQRAITKLFRHMPQLISVDLSGLRCWKEPLWLSNFSTAVIAHIQTPDTIVPITISDDEAAVFSHQSAFAVIATSRETVFSTCMFHFTLSRQRVSIVPGNATASSVTLNARYTGMTNLFVWDCAEIQDLPALVPQGQAIVLNITKGQTMVTAVAVSTVTAGFAVDLSMLALRTHLDYNVPTNLIFEVSGFSNPNLLSQGLVEKNVTVTLETCDDVRKYAVNGTTKCEPCPENGVCDGTDAVIKVSDENVYCWRDHLGKWRCDPCDPQLRNCLTFDSQRLCAAGYLEGPWCLDCEPGYGRSYKNRACLACPHNSVPYLAFGVELAIALGLMIFALAAAQEPGPENDPPNPHVTKLKLLWQCVMVRGFPFVVALTAYQRARLEVTNADPNVAAAGVAAVVAMFTTVQNLMDCSARQSKFSAHARLWLPLALATCVWLLVFGILLLVLAVKQVKKKVNVTFGTIPRVALQSVTSVIAACTPYIVNQIGSANVNGITVFAAEPSLLYRDYVDVAVVSSVLVASCWVALFTLLVLTLREEEEERVVPNTTSLGTAGKCLSHITWWPYVITTSDDQYKPLPNKALVVDSLLNIAMASTSAVLPSHVSESAALMLLLLSASKISTVTWVHNRLDRTNWERFRKDREVRCAIKLARVLAFEQHMERVGRWSKEFATITVVLALLQSAMGPSVDRHAGYAACCAVSDTAIAIMIALYLAGSLAVVFCSDQLAVEGSGRDEGENAQVQRYVGKLNGKPPSLIARPGAVLLHTPSLIGTFALWIVNTLYVIYAAANSDGDSDGKAHRAIAFVNIVSAVLLVGYLVWPLVVAAARSARRSVADSCCVETLRRIIKRFLTSAEEENLLNNDGGGHQDGGGQQDGGGHQDGGGQQKGAAPIYYGDVPAAAGTGR